jgi:hypothetical protein
LAALDCYVTIEGNNPYEKTYQDKLDVPHLVDDIFSGRKPLNLDKIFVENQLETNTIGAQNNHQMLLSQMLSPDFQYFPGTQSQGGGAQGPMT